MDQFQERLFRHNKVQRNLGQKGTVPIKGGHIRDRSPPPAELHIFIQGSAHYLAECSGVSSRCEI